MLITTRCIAGNIAKAVTSVSKIGPEEGWTNERKYPYVVELAVTGEGLDIALSRRIMNFHKSRHIHPRHGRTIIKQEQIYYRWCFPDLAAAHAFVEQFGGGFYKP